MDVHLGGPATYLGATTCQLTRSLIRQRTPVANHRMLILLALVTTMKTTSLRVSGQWINWFSLFINSIYSTFQVEECSFLRPLYNNPQLILCTQWHWQCDALAFLRCLVTQSCQKQLLMSLWDRELLQSLECDIDNGGLETVPQRGPRAAGTGGSWKRVGFLKYNDSIFEYLRKLLYRAKCICFI